MTSLLFYDGSCALCHGFVRWVLARDRAARFQFAPLQGETFNRLVPAEQQVGLPDSVVVRDAAGALYVESDAVVFVLRALGRHRTATALAMLPRPVRDAGYRVIARVRYAVFGRKSDWCPVVPAELRLRFLP